MPDEPDLTAELDAADAIVMGDDDGPHEFKPDWCLAPAAHLKEWMEDNGVSAALIGVISFGRDRRAEGAAVVTEVLDRKPLTDLHAKVLERGTHIPARFWLALEHNYRAGLAAGLKDCTEDDAVKDGSEEKR